MSSWTGPRSVASRRRTPGSGRGALDRRADVLRQSGDREIGADAIHEDQVADGIVDAKTQDALVLGRVVPVPCVIHAGKLHEGDSTRPRAFNDLHVALCQPLSAERPRGAFDLLQVRQPFLVWNA